MHRGADADGTFTAIYWIMLSVGRASVGVLIYLAARALGAAKRASRTGVCLWRFVVSKFYFNAPAL